MSESFPSFPFNPARVMSIAGSVQSARPTPADVKHFFDDPDFVFAVDAVFQNGNWTSVSHIQRELRIGYTRATELVDLMVKARIIASQQHIANQFNAIIDWVEWQDLKGACQ